MAWLWQEPFNAQLPLRTDIHVLGMALTQALTVLITGRCTAEALVHISGYSLVDPPSGQLLSRSLLKGQHDFG